MTEKHIKLGTFFTKRSWNFEWYEVIKIKKLSTTFILANVKDVLTGELMEDYTLRIDDFRFRIGDNIVYICNDPTLKTLISLGYDFEDNYQHTSVTPFITELKVS